MNRIIKSIGTIISRVDLKAVLMAFLAAGMMIIGWCFSKNIPAFFSNKFRLFIYLTYFFNAYTGIVFVPRFFGDINRKGMPRDTREDLVMLGATLLQIVSAFLSPYSDASGFMKMPESNIIRVVGFVMYLLGIILVITSYLKLKDNFSIHVTKLDSHELITTGVYKFIRHPWYLGMIFAFFVLPFVFLSFLGLLISFLQVALVVWRIRREERFMAEAFGIEWDEYKKRSKMIIPFVL